MKNVPSWLSSIIGILGLVGCGIMAAKAGNITGANQIPDIVILVSFIAIFLGNALNMAMPSVTLGKKTDGLVNGSTKNN